jgi:hypothetical protein
MKRIPTRSLNCAGQSNGLFISSDVWVQNLCDDDWPTDTSYCACVQAQRHSGTAVNGGEAGCVRDRRRMVYHLSSSRLLPEYWSFVSTGTIRMYNHVKGKRHISEASIFLLPLKNIFMCMCVCVCVGERAHSNVVVVALCYNPEGRGFETQWDEWFIF